MGASRLVVVLVHLIGFSWLLTKNALPSLALTIGKPRCQTECGNVRIPFPFGIGSTNCYVDDWLEIFGNTSTFPHTPYLKRTNLQVLNISLEDYYGSSRDVIQVRNPVTFWNCTGKETRKSLDSTGSPFVYSAYHNKFTAVSCEVRALMSSSSSLDDGEISAGCKSKCLTTTNHHNRSCNGVNCCQTTIPSYAIKNFSTTFQSETDKTCKYAFVVDQDWFISNNTNFVAIRDMDDVPVTLEWTLYYSMQHIFGADQSQWNSSIRCQLFGNVSSVNDTTGLRCYCDSGFKGNQYILGGCQDVNECQIASARCHGAETCVNTIGSYKCRKSKVKIVLIGLMFKKRLIRKK